MPWTFIVVVAGLLAVALLFASVGHGGASGYLAVLALAGLAPETIRPTALCLNVIVSSVALARFAGRGYFRWHIFWPFAITAVPCAFLAGWLLALPARQYQFVLGVVLLFAAWRLAMARAAAQEQVRPIPLAVALPIGAIIGLVSGLIGIGGGIFLSPVLVLCAWATPRQTAAVSAAFILISSIAALSGLFVQFDGLNIEPGQTAIFALVVLLGAVIGSSLGATRFDPLMLRRVLAVILLLAAVKMIVPT